MKKRAVTILLHNEDGLILGVSRKDDHTSFGLPGGKCEDGESDVEAIVRETKEETGLDVTNVRPYFTRADDEFDCVTFIGNYSGDIKTSESGLVKWVSWGELEAGKFGEYNRALHAYFDTEHKYDTGDVLYNPETNEIFMVMMRIGKSANEVNTPVGYFVRAIYSEMGYSFVKKSALDNLNFKSHKLKDSHLLNTDFNDIGVAQFYALSSHFDTNQYYGENDCFLYSFHLAKVVRVGRRFRYLIPDDAWKNVEGGLWSHDIIEDARKTFNNVKNMVGQIVADLSFALANSTGKTRDERADDVYYEKIRRTRYATFIKLCDRIANIEYSLSTGSSMGDKYKKEFDKFAAQLFVPGEYEEIWSHLDKLLGGNGDIKKLKKTGND